MSDPPYTVRRFLDAVRTVDDRALSPRVLDHIAQRLSDIDEPRVIEIGAGIGAMPIRLVTRGILPDGTRYTGIEKDPELAAVARDQLTGHHATPRTDGIDLHGNDRTISVTIEAGDGYEAIERSTWDLIIVNAVPPDRDTTALVEDLTAQTTPTGACYVPVAYDGVTEFVPEHPHDEAVVAAYHATLTDDGGWPHLGRTLIDAVQATTARLIAVAGADRIIQPTNEGYPNNEGDVLHHTINAIEAITPEADIPPDRLDTWVTHRRNHVDQGELTYIAHGLDVLFGP